MKEIIIINIIGIICNSLKINKYFPFSISYQFNKLVKWGNKGNKTINYKFNFWEQGKNYGIERIIGQIVSIFSLILILKEILIFNTNNYEYQGRFEILGYNLGYDGIGLSLIVLICLLDPILFLLIKGENKNKKERKRIVNNILILKIFLILNFGTLDLFLFFISFELILIPMFLLITRYGSKYSYFLPRLEAGVRFFLYTILGSLFMLISIIILYFKFGTTSNEILNIKISYNNFLGSIVKEELIILKIIWILLFFSFIIKIPMFPFHTWLPLAHSDAPTIGSIILAALLLKLGSFGIIRYSLLLFNNNIYLPITFSSPVLKNFFKKSEEKKLSLQLGELGEQGSEWNEKTENSIYNISPPSLSHPFSEWVEKGEGGEAGLKYLSIYIYEEFIPILYILGLLSIYYASILSIRSLYDLKKLIAYSSIIHMNFSIFGFFSKDIVGLIGSTFLIFTHAFISSSLFLLVGILYKRYHTRYIYYYQGLFTSLPIFSTFFLIFAFANISLPFCSSFLSEFFILISSFHSNPFLSLLLVLSLIISSSSFMWITIRLLYGSSSSYIFFSLPHSLNFKFFNPRDNISSTLQIKGARQEKENNNKVISPAQDLPKSSHQLGELVEWGYNLGVVEGAEKKNIGYKDLSFNEFLALIPLLFFTIYFAFFPNSFLSYFILVLYPLL